MFLVSLTLAACVAAAPAAPRVRPQTMHANPHTAAGIGDHPHLFTWEVPYGFQHSYSLQILSSEIEQDGAAAVLVDTGKVMAAESHR